jgi:hypothetical protein
MAFKEDTDAPLIITIGAVSGFLTIVVVIGLQAWYVSEEQRELDRKTATVVHQPLEDLRAAQTTNINSYRWADSGKQTVAMPIDKAMTLLIQNNGKLPATQPANR